MENSNGCNTGYPVIFGGPRDSFHLDVMIKFSLVLTKGKAGTLLCDGRIPKQVLKFSSQGGWSIIFQAYMKYYFRRIILVGE